MGRGRLRIFLGAAPGVGKTYAMLAEGQRLRALGSDVVVGYVEPHGRRPTAAMAEGLETVPRRVVRHRGARFTEMDPDAVLARRPQVALVDELAHSNVPGSRNAKRWQDVEELLDAGIDVVTTLNVQHLESLNDVVRQITGVRQRETLPDEVARRADQIELVDLTPEALRRRMVHGDIYPPDRIESALTHYFRVGNLTALREIALLWLADRVEEGLQRYRAEHGIAAPWETRERILVGLSGGAEGETLIRRAARICARTPGSDLLALHVVPEEGSARIDPAALNAQRVLLESLGGSFHQTTGEDVVAALLRFAEAENVTQIVLGATRHNRLASSLRAGVGERTIKGSGPIDVHIVTHEEAAGRAAFRLPRPGAGAGPRRLGGALAGAAVLLPALTLLLAAVRGRLGLAGVLAAYLLLVVVVALAGGVWPALLVAVAAALLADYYFTAPLHSLGMARPEEIVALAVFVTTAVLVGTAAGTAARATRQAARATSEARTLSRLAANVLRGQDLPALVELIRENFGLTAVSLLERDPRASPTPRWYVVASAGDAPPERPYEADVESPVDDFRTLAARGPGLRTEDRRLLDACAAELGLAHARGRFAGPGDPFADAERTRAALLLAAGRDLRAPLRTAEDALGRLRQRPQERAPEEKRLLETARTAVHRAARLVTDLDDLSRLHAGALDLYLRPVDVGEALGAALDDLGAGGHSIVVRLPEDLPDVIADAALLTRVLAALGADALRHSPPDRPPLITAENRDGRVAIRVADGSGGPAAATGPAGPRADGLALRLSRDLAEAMGGSLKTSRRGGGYAVALTLPGSAPGGPRRGRPPAPGT
ncbi:DUF4118 domain-containing protein [Streptomyces sp. RS10V-4]|uniref:sensor histidine kinase n=1 Tax=Streptomyces rhizoryzae TaxID=2932493 RepID=UPI0020060E7D|nr:DUF4118 domain-containing protein [Streptomyces rhizoryzae]MCK7622203.1 DUF4118 domain-containing protein [Streptomyces rhizoryzae]